MENVTEFDSEHLIECISWLGIDNSVACRLYSMTEDNTPNLWMDSALTPFGLVLLKDCRHVLSNNEPPNKTHSLT